MIDEKFISGIDFSVELKTCDGSLTVSESGGFKKTEVPFEWKKINLDLSLDAINPKVKFDLTVE